MKICLLDQKNPNESQIPIKCFHKEKWDVKLLPLDGKWFH